VWIAVETKVGRLRAARTADAEKIAAPGIEEAVPIAGTKQSPPTRADFSVRSQSVRRV